MKKTVLLIPILLAAVVAANAQKLVAPTLTSVPPTAAQHVAMMEGIALHDAGKHDQAIAKYRSVLAENRDCTLAMYELTMTLYAKGEKEKALELANIGSKYVSDELPLFYVIMANVLDDYNKPDAAIKVYLEGLKLLSGNTQFGRYRASLNYNLGVTYVQQNKAAEARKYLKAAIEDDRAYASPHYLLAVVLRSTRHRIPAILAASRFISLEYKTQRSRQAAQLIADLLNPPKVNPETGNLTITLDADSPKDEGDFASIDVLLGFMVAGKNTKDPKRTENEIFVDALETVFGLVASDKKLRSTFVGKNYVSFLIDMKNNDYIDVFGYLTLYLSGKQDALTWLEKNDAKVKRFASWAKAF